MNLKKKLWNLLLVKYIFNKYTFFYRLIQSIEFINVKQVRLKLYAISQLLKIKLLTDLEEV